MKDKGTEIRTIVKILTRGGRGERMQIGGGNE